MATSRTDSPSSSGDLGAGTWSFFDQASGLLSGTTFSGPVAFLAQNTPAGHAAVAGSHDPLRRRVDLGTGEVVAWKPPAPPDDQLRSWRWDAALERWLAIPTAAAVAAKVRAERDRRMSASDWVVSKAVELGEPVPEAWRAYRQVLRDLPSQAGFPDAVEWPTPP